MKINVYNNKDIFFELERNRYEVDNTDNIITPNTSWFILKPFKTEPKLNRYKLTPSEIIRIGRITMRIRDIIFDDKKKSLSESYNSNNDLKELYTLRTEGSPKIGDDNIIYKKKEKNENKDINNKKPEKIKTMKSLTIKRKESIFEKVEKKNNICRICYLEEDDQKNPLIQPCICTGSMKYIHLSCLKQWISTHSCVRLNKTEECAVFLIKPVTCELCKTKFPDYIKHQNKLYPLLDFNNEYESYMTLESLTLDKYKNKFIYVVSLEKIKKIKAGRGDECHILLSDISVSRIHCYFIVENKNVYLVDNDSKFGTLTFIQNKKLKIVEGIPLFIQVGRTFFEIMIKKKFRFFSCCEAEEKNNIFYYYNQNEKYIKDHMGLVIKDDENEDIKVYFKNNNSQEVKGKKKPKTDSFSVGQKDKMSDNEYLLIKHKMKNKDIRKNIFLGENEAKNDKNESDDNYTEEVEESEINRQNDENNSIPSSLNREENYEEIENDNNIDENENIISVSSENGRNNNNDSTFEQNE